MSFPWLGSSWHACPLPTALLAHSFARTWHLALINPTEHIYHAAAQQIRRGGRGVPILCSGGAADERRGINTREALAHVSADIVYSVHKSACTSV